MLLTMVETRPGSPDGIRVVTYEKGESYEVPAALGEIFLGEGWARPARKGKQLSAAPRNKDAGAAPRNKVGRAKGTK